MILYEKNNLKNRFYKYYRLEENDSMLEFIKVLKESNINITRIKVTDERDYIPITPSGNYTIDEIISMYDSINNNKLSEDLYITFFGQYQNKPLNIQLWPKKNEIDLISNNNSYDIINIIKQNKENI